MNRFLIYISISLSLMSGVAFAAPHLTPDTFYAASPGEYQHKLKHIFSAGYDTSVVLSGLVVPSFSTEYLVGVREKNGEATIFSITPNARVANIERLEKIESGKFEKYDAAGKIIPFNSDPSYRGLREITPRDYKEVKINLRESKVSSEIANEIALVWKDALLGVKRESKPDLFLDGSVYHFSMKIKGYGLVSGQLVTTDNNAKMEALAGLADAMYGYSKGDLIAEDIALQLQKYKMHTGK